MLLNEILIVIAFSLVCYAATAIVIILIADIIDEYISKKRVRRQRIIRRINMR